MRLVYIITAQWLPQIKELHEAVEENVEEGEIVMTTLNGLPRSWDSFIQGICAIRKLISFSILREECAQEEARLMRRKENMGATNDQAFTVHTRKNFKKKDNFHHNKKKDNKSNKTKRDTSNVQCYTCDEKGHLAIYCPIMKRDTMLILSNMKNQQTKYSDERRMIRMKSMC